MITKSKTETQKIAAKLAKKILKAYAVPRQARELLLPERSRRATLIALSGTLGSGKTTFVQGFMKAMGVKHRITSPTFVIFRKYHSSQKSKSPCLPAGRKSQKFLNVYHFDLYRLDKSQDFMNLFSAKGGPASGWKKIISDKNNIVLIEWPEVIKKILPKNTIWVEFKHGKNKKEREIRIKNNE